MTQTENTTKISTVTLTKHPGPNSGQSQRHDTYEQAKAHVDAFMQTYEAYSARVWIGDHSAYFQCLVPSECYERLTNADEDRLFDQIANSFIAGQPHKVTRNKQQYKAAFYWYNETPTDIRTGLTINQRTGTTWKTIHTETGYTSVSTVCRKAAEYLAALEQP